MAKKGQQREHLHQRGIGAQAQSGKHKGGSDTERSRQGVDKRDGRVLRSDDGRVRAGRNERVERELEIQSRANHQSLGHDSVERNRSQYEKSKRHSEFGKQAPLHEGRQHEGSRGEWNEHGRGQQGRRGESGQREGQPQLPDKARRYPASTQQGRDEHGAERVSTGQKQQSAGSILNRHNAGVYLNKRHH